MDVLIHVANVLYLFSYLMRDILWLRILTVVAACCLIPYFYFRPEPLMPAIYWNLAFTALNVFWITRLLLERRPVTLSETEQRLYCLVFRTLTPREWLKLLKLGRWEERAQGDQICEVDQVLDELMVIDRGRARVDVEGKTVAELSPGQFIGGMSFFTGKPVGATVTALEPVRLVCWPKPKLSAFLKQHPDLHSALQIILGRELTTSLRTSWTAIAGA